MARVCQLCARGSNRIISRSKSHIGTITHQQVNLQKKTLFGLRMKVCTSCIKTLKRVEA